MRKLNLEKVSNALVSQLVIGKLRIFTKSDFMTLTLKSSDVHKIIQILTLDILNNRMMFF